MEWIYKNIKDGRYIKFDYYLSFGKGDDVDWHTDDLNEASIVNDEYHGSHNNHESFPYLEEKRRIRKLKLKKIYES